MTDEHIPRRAKQGPDGYAQERGRSGPDPHSREGNMTDQPRILGGRYEIGRVIGRGGMALVSQARDLRLGRDVAIKELRTDLAGDPTFQARFRREAQAAAGLNHPNIVSVYDTGEEMDPQSQTPVPYIVMELVQGRTLRDILRDGRKILPRRALEFTVGVLEALAYSHKSGIIHRDIKPANVMLTSTGIVKVMDFGIARAVADTSSTMTQTAAVIGTAQYLSPEQARGETVDARSDIYSAGCLMYELMVSRPPFQGDSPVSVAYQHVREQPVPPSQLDPEITAPMDAVVLKALAKDPDDRYATAGEMRDDVQRILGGQRVTATLPPPVPPLVAAPSASAASAATAVLPAGAAAANIPVDQTMGGMGATMGTGTMPPVGPEQRRSRAGLWWTLAIVSLLLVGLVAGWQLMLRNQEPAVKEVPVPAGLLYKTEAQATALLLEVGLKARTSSEETADATTIGQVLRTDPIAGTPVPEGSEVLLVINAGPKMATIPEGLLQMKEEDALQALADAGLTGRAVAANDEDKDDVKGTVINVTPAEGTSIPATQVVTLTIATGQSRLPSLLGMTREEALQEAADYGFKNLVFEPEDGTTVLRTDPQPQTLIDRDARVTVHLQPAAPSPSPTPARRTPDPTTEPDPNEPTPSPSPTP
nr:Stk1 family PASTA domain-containing Ser/Thr kinase [Propioniciclava sinopodophylli]